MRRIFLWILCVCGLLSGCYRKEPERPAETEPLCRYVIRADVICRTGNVSQAKQYIREEKLQSVLNYLRLLEDVGDVPGLPKDVSGADYEILLYFSDGSCRVYRQKGAAYLSQDGGPWQILKQRQGSRLYTLFKLLPSDQ